MDPLVIIMKKILAESYTVYLKTQNYHWNGTSKHAFYAVHKMFETQYQELAEAIDEIAEKIRQLGHPAPASFADYSKLSEIEEGDPTAHIDHMLKDLARDQEKLVNRLNEGIKIAQKCNDEGAADLLTERIRVHDKNKWMLESSL